MGGKSDKMYENELNWIKSLTKSDIIGIRIGYWNRNRISESDIIAIGRRFRNHRIAYALHREFLDSLYKVRVSVNPNLFFCLWALFPLCFFSDSYENNIVKFLVFSDTDCVQSILRTFGEPMVKLDVLISFFQDCIFQRNLGNEFIGYNYFRIVYEEP